jgi:probable HAF family extracellular repeat protein
MVKSNKTFLQLALIFLIITSYFQTLYAVQYEITNIDAFDGDESLARSINDYGQVTGQVQYHEYPERFAAFYWSPEASYVLGTLGGSSSNGHKINNKGEIVGKAEKPDGSNAAFYWNSADGIIEIEVPDVWYSSAYGINNNSQIVVYGRRNDDYWGLQHIGLTGTYQNLTEFDFFCELGGMPFDISDTGHIVGTAYVNIEGAIQNHAFILYDGQITDLGTLGGKMSIAYEVNSKGQVAVFPKLQMAHNLIMPFYGLRKRLTSVLWAGIFPVLTQ